MISVSSERRSHHDLRGVFPIVAALATVALWACGGADGPDALADDDSNTSDADASNGSACPTCSPHATCDRNTGECICLSGYQGNGVTCEDIDGCATKPCFDGVTCTDVPAPGEGFTCGPCPAGYQGNGMDCADIDGCAEKPCFDGVACTDVAAPEEGFSCGACPSGYQGDGVSCADIDSCAANPCFEGVACTDASAPGEGFSCGACPPGYQGDGVTCKDIDACAAKPCFQGVACTDLAAPLDGFSCGACPPGYQGDGITCTDIDGCAAAPCSDKLGCTDVPAPGDGFSCGKCEYIALANDCLDADGDGHPKGVERLHGTSDSGLDADEDGEIDGLDTDKDGIPDSVEIIGVEKNAQGAFQIIPPRSNPTRASLYVLLLHAPDVTGFSPAKLREELRPYFDAAELDLKIVTQEVTNATAFYESCFQTLNSEPLSPAEEKGWLDADAKPSYLEGVQGDVAAMYRYAHVGRVCADIGTWAPVKGMIQYQGGFQFLVKMRSPGSDWSAARKDEWHRALANLTAHELGHSLGLHHGGNTEDDCSPIYPSVMNHAYDFQVGTDETCGVIRFSEGRLTGKRPIRIGLGYSEFDVLGALSPSSEPLENKFGQALTPGDFTFLQCLGSSDRIDVNGVRNAGPFPGVVLQTCGRDTAPVTYCANWDRDDVRGHGYNWDTGEVLDEAWDPPYEAHELLITRTSGGSLSDIVSGCSPRDLDPTGGVDPPLPSEPLGDHDDITAIKANLRASASHALCTGKPCTKGVVEPASAGEVDAVLQWW